MSLYCLFFTAKMPVFNKTQTTLILYYLLTTTLHLLPLPLSIFSAAATSKTLNDPHSKFYPYKRLIRKWNVTTTDEQLTKKRI